MKEEIEEKQQELISILLQMLRIRQSLKEMHLRAIRLDRDICSYYNLQNNQNDDPETDAKFKNELKF